MSELDQTLNRVIAALDEAQSDSTVCSGVSEYDQLDCARAADILEEMSCPDSLVSEVRLLAEPIEPAVDSLILEGIKAFAGAHVHNVCKEAVEIATRLMSEISVEFNGTKLTVAPHSDPDDLYQAYWNRIN